MAAKPHDLLGHIAPLDLERRLLNEPRLVDVPGKELAKSLLDAAAGIEPADFRALRHPHRELLERVNADAHVGREVRAFAQSGLLELAERLADDADERGPFRGRRRRRLPRAIEVRHTAEQREVDLAGEPERPL